MFLRRPGRRHLVRGAAAVAVLLATGLYLRLHDLQDAAAVAGVLSLLVTVGTLLWSPAGPGRVAGATFLDDPGPLLDRLADRNLTPTWDAQWRDRRLHDPGPLPVRWTTDGTLGDHWQNVRGTDDPRPLDLAGGWAGLASVFERVPSRRLVAVGSGGQGKTVLCLHLARELLAHRARGGPVPVLLALSGWDPVRVSLDEWVAERLPLDVAPGLADDAGDGRTVARAMMDDGHLVLLLDGLDELPESAHRAAIARLNRARPGPLFLTCRRAEFAAATAGDPLTAAAVVRLAPLPPGTVASWLDRTAAPLAAGGSKWTALLAGDGSLGAALRSPLLANLARSVYSENDADPGELARHATAGAHEVETLLIDRLVAIAYGAGSETRDGPWTADEAGRYLATLARGLAAHGVDRLEWWRLERALPRWRARLVKAGLVAVVTAVVVTVTSRLSGAPPGDLGALVFGAGLTGLIVLVADPPAATRAPLMQRLGRPHGLARTARTVGRAMLRGGLIGLAVGVVVWVAALFGLWPVTSWALVLTGLLAALGVFGLVGGGMGLAVSFPLALLDVVSHPLPVDRSPDPVGMLRVDRRWSVARAGAFGLLVGSSVFQVVFFAIALASGLYSRVTRIPLLPPPGPGFWPGVYIIVPTAVIAGLGLLLTHTAWGRFTFARVFLALGGRIPWRLMTFLSDARDREVLRQVGSAYAFRHERLQSRLAETGT